METHTTSGHATGEHNKHYTKLALMVVLAFISMYVLMYSMVDTFSNVLPNKNQFYMAALMTMPMIIIELLLMSAMYMNRKRNSVIFAVSIVALVGFFMLIRRQGAVTDKQFLKSMIPHHGAAILMAKQAVKQDPEIRELSQKIIKDQEAEIELMKTKLRELKNK